MADVDTVCSECGSPHVTAEIGARDAKIVCHNCGNEGTARYEENG
jgi:DNA-directed RNA polymerase subunit RPC12/RpoP